MKIVCPFCKRPEEKEIDLEHLMSSFKFLRLKRQLTLRELEKKVKISNAYLSQLESGSIKNPSFNVIVKLLQFYGIEIELTS